MAKAKISSVMRTSVEGTLNLDNENIIVEIEDIGNLPLCDIFKKYNGEYVKINIAVSNDGYENPDDVDNDEDLEDGELS